MFNWGECTQGISHYFAGFIDAILRDKTHFPMRHPQPGLLDKPQLFRHNFNRDQAGIVLSTPQMWMSPNRSHFFNPSLQAIRTMSEGSYSVTINSRCSRFWHFMANFFPSELFGLLGRALWKTCGIILSLKCLQLKPIKSCKALTNHHHHTRVKSYRPRGCQLARSDAHTMGSRAFSRSDPQLWNSLPSAIHNIETHLFKIASSLSLSLQLCCSIFIII